MNILWGLSPKVLQSPNNPSMLWICVLLQMMKLNLKEGNKLIIGTQTRIWICEGYFAPIFSWTTCNVAVLLDHEQYMWGHPRRAGHGGEVWQNVVHWRRECQTTSVFLPWEPHEEYEKARRQDTEDELPRSEVPSMILEISGEITPERMKGWSQSKNNTQLWMWLVIEARSDAVKSNIA